MNANSTAQRHIPSFARYVGIDYSGAETPRDSLPGLRVYMDEGDGLPMEVLPSRSPRKHWTRRGVAEWLLSSASPRRRW